MTVSRDEVYEKVRAVLTDALGVDDDEVAPESKLVGDLGAESIDMLDIVFRLEKAFSISIPKDGLFPTELLNNPEYVEGDRMTPIGLETLKTAMPHADFTDFEKDPSMANIWDLMTAQTVVNYVSGRLAAV